MIRTSFLVALALAAAPAWADGADPRRPPAISTSGVPELPADLIAKLVPYQNIREASFLGWAPDGPGILIRTRFGNAAQLYRVYEPGGRREQVTSFDEPTTGAFVPGTKGQILAVLSESGDEDLQIFQIDLAEFRTELLTDGKSRNELGPMSDDGQRVIFIRYRRDSGEMDFYAVDPRRPADGDVLIKSQGRWNPHAWSPDGDRLLVDRFASIHDAYAFVFDMPTKSLKALPVQTGTQGSSAIREMAFAADGRTYYLSTDASNEFHRLTRASIDRPAQYEYLTDDLSWDVDEFEVDRKSDRIAFTINDDGVSRLFVLEGKTRREIPLPMGVVSGLKLSPDGSQLGFTLSRPTAPADVYSVPVAEGELTRWTFSEAGGLDPTAFAVPEGIRFAAFDGREIPAWYYRPAAASSETKAPVLIHVHDGPESQRRPTFSPAAQFYSSEGIAVIHPNVRGSSGYGKTYLKLDNAELREDSVEDIGALLDWIAQQPELDATRVAISGRGHGGYIVLASLVRYGDRLKAGVNYAGISNFVTFLERMEPFRRLLRRAEFGDETDPQMRSVLERISPLANADKIASPLMIVHGREDRRVPIFQTEQIVESLHAKQREVWAVYADNEGHEFAKKDNADYARAVEAMFLQRRLQGK